MYCEECGSKLPEGAKFCENCGARVASAQQPEAAIDNTAATGVIAAAAAMTLGKSSPKPAAQAPSAEPAHSPKLYYPDPTRFKRYMSIKDRILRSQQIDNDPFED